MNLDLKEVLAYVLESGGGSVPDGFLSHLIRHRDAWDAEFTRRVNDLAYELRPDLAVWEIVVDEQGQLHEYLLPLVRVGQDAA